MGNLYSSCADIIIISAYIAYNEPMVVLTLTGRVGYLWLQSIKNSPQKVG